MTTVTVTETVSGTIELSAMSDAPTISVEIPALQGPPGAQGADGATGPAGPPGTTDYNALTNKPTIPSALADLTQDATHRTVTDAEKATWNSGGATNLSVSTTASTVTVESSNGTDAVLPAATSTVAGVATAAQITKLDGIATGATANSPDATLLNRANHTGAQAISTVTGLQTALDGKQPLATVLTNTTASFTTALETKLSGIAAGAEANVNADWNAASGDAQILNKPTIPTTLSQLSEDTTHRVVTDAEKTTWNGKQNALGFTPVPDTRTVAGKALTANITLVKADVGLGSVDNTSDLAKPVSTATQSALDGKEPAFSKNTAFNKNFGTTAGTVCEGNDARLSPTHNGLSGLNTGDYLHLTAAEYAAMLEEAPLDGKQYARKDGAWVEVVSGGAMATFDTTLDFGTGGMTATASIADASMTTTKIIQAFYTDHLDEVAVLDMRVNERSRTAGVGFEIIGVSPNGAFGTYPVRCIVSGT